LDRDIVSLFQYFEDNNGLMGIRLVRASSLDNNFLLGMEYSCFDLYYLDRFQLGIQLDVLTRVDNSFQLDT